VAFAFILLSPRCALAVEHFQITSCPYTASVPGAIYTVVGNVGTRWGDDCIDVTAPGITVLINGSVYAGGTAINIYPAAKRAHITGLGVVSTTGSAASILDKGDSAVIETLTIGIWSDGGAGIALEGVNGSAVKNNVIGGGSVGVSLDDTKNCTVDGNTIATVAVGSGYSPIGI